VLPGALGVSVVNNAGGPVTSDSEVGLTNIPNQVNKGVISSQVDQITGILLFKGTPNEITINVLAPPQITATAGGTPGTAKVTYTEPVLQVKQGNTVLGTLDAATANTSLTIPALATLSLGTLTKTVKADGTSASGTADLLLVQIGVSPLPLNVATVAIAPATVSAVAPAGGVFCPPPSNPLDEAHKDASSGEVAAGQQFTYTVTVPNRGTCTLTNVKVVDTVSSTGVLPTIVSSTPAASSTAGSTLTYNDIGPLAPNETKNIQILMQAPSPLPAGTVFHNHAVITAICQGAPAGTTPFQKIIDIDGPKAFVPGASGCHLDDSNKSADHIKVFVDETFNYYIHVFNDGTQSCSGVVVTDTVPANTTFVNASDGGTLTGNVVKWTLPALASGASHTLVLQVKVNHTVATGTTLPNTALIKSPSEPGLGTTVQTGGPLVTGVSVLNGPQLPNAGANTSLPVTGADFSTFAPYGIGLLVIAVGALGWRRRFHTA
jgi:uncharacterized repeat protein (TIGR01451 family)